MNEMRFRIDCVPPTATAQQKGAVVIGGRVRFYTKAKVRRAEDLLASLLMPHRPQVPFSRPVTLVATWTFPWRKSERKGVVKAGSPIPHTSRPDLDNLEKNLLDVMTSLGFWSDDSLVTRKATSKYWGPAPGIDIAILETSAPLVIERDADCDLFSWSGGDA